MSSRSLNLNLNSVRSKTIWDRGSCSSWTAVLAKEHEDSLRLLLTHARNIKQEIKTHQKRKQAYQRLQERGVQIVQELEEVNLDFNEVKGLIGEMLLEDFVSSQGMEPIHIKWRESGSSKSKGIDIVAKKRLKGRSRLVALEAKHLHADIRDSHTNHVHLKVKNRFVRGMHELNYVRVNINLLSLVGDFGAKIRGGDAVGANTSVYEDHCNFINSTLMSADYDLEIMCCFDAKYDHPSIFDSLQTLEFPTDVGDHYLTLDILGAKNLEHVTENMGE